MNVRIIACIIWILKHVFLFCSNVNHIQAGKYVLSVQ